jgi:tetratricopeptide (TPR) repeat protein
MGDRFSLGNDLAAEVADFLRVRLGKEVRLREWTVGTREPRARDMVAKADEMRAQALAAARGPDSVAVLTARRSLEISDIVLAEAERLDPEWVEPTLRRGWLALDRIDLTDMDRKREWTAQAAAHAERALRREPGYPAALELRGTAYWLEADDSIPGRWSERVARAEADLRAATEADPSLASAWATLSQVLRFQTDFEEAAFAARRAYHKDAYLRNIDQVLDVLYRSNLALERTEESGRWCALGRRKFPSDWKFVQCELDILSSPATRKPDPLRALRLLRELREMDPPDKARLAGRPYHPIYRTVRTAVVLARAGREREARDLLARARREAGDDRAMNLFLAYDEAYLRLVLGERERAFDLLTHYVRHRPELKPYALRDPQFRTLWSDTAGARLSFLRR